jgi:trimethylamine---corrinoid protein Co-methyltransferase
MIVEQTSCPETAPSYSKRVIWLLRRLIQADNLHTGALRKRHHLSSSQLGCVIALDDHGPMPLCQIAKEIMVDSSTVTGLIDRLEMKGLVERSRISLDRRIITVCLTEAGRNLARNAPSLLNQQIIGGLEALPLSKKELIIGGLMSLTDLLDLPEVGGEEESRTSRTFTIKEKGLNQEQLLQSKTLLGESTVNMLLRSHEDALWILENLGVGCKQPEIQKAYKALEEEGAAFVHENRIYLTSELVRRCLSTVPGVADFFVPLNSFFIGGTAPYVYDDERGTGGVAPRPEDVEKIARIAEAHPVVAGMGRGVKLKDEVEQMTIMAEHCSKPLYVAVTSDASLARAKEIYHERKNIMIVFCLTRPPLEVNENFSDHFVKVVREGLPVFISAMPMAGISAPYCYNGVLAMTHAEVLFGITTAQLLNPGVISIHAGYPTIADPRLDYNPNYGLVSHNLLNILMAHLNLILDLPTFQSAGTTHEEHPTERAFEDAKMGQALCMKYGFHMMRHPFAFLRYLIDFSFAKLERAIRIAEEVKSEDAPAVEMPAYDERGMESIQRIGLGSYMDDPLTTANLGKVFVT